MSLLVLKFGGTSLGDIDRIKKVALMIHEIKLKGNDVAVVVSAMAGDTNKILSLCSDIINNRSLGKSAEIDNALSTGETLSASLLCLALMEMELKAISLQAWQAGIRSNDTYQDAMITGLNSNIISDYIKCGYIPVLTGFQAINTKGRITTIGRGGSDTSAAIIAASIGADSCDIYTDVEGIYTLDPRLSDRAKIIKQISFEEVLELAGSGAKVLHPRCVEICMRYKIPLRVFSSFTNKSGTIIMNEVNEINKITGISFLKNLLFIKIPNIGGEIGDFLEKLRARNININSICFTNYSGLNFATQEEYLEDITHFLNDLGYIYELEKNIMSITIVGASIRHDLGVIEKIIKIFEDNNMEIFSTSHSEIKLTLLCKEEGAVNIIKKLHTTLLESGNI